MPRHGGAAQPSGRVTGQVVTDEHRAMAQRLAEAVAVPDGARTWVQVSYEDGRGEVVVRVEHGGVQGEVRFPLPADLRALLGRLLGQHAEAARADLRHGLVQTLAAMSRIPPEA